MSSPDSFANIRKALSGVHAKAATTTTHTVGKGETLSGIGKRYGMDYKDIASANGIKDVNKIQIGQSLNLNRTPPVVPTPAPTPVVQTPKPVVTPPTVPTPAAPTPRAPIAPTPTVNSGYNRDIAGPLIRGFEGTEYTPYQDVDKRAVGVGHNLTAESPAKFRQLFGDDFDYDAMYSGRTPMTDEQVNTLYNSDLDKHWERVLRAAPGAAKLPDEAKAALLNMEYRTDWGPDTKKFVNAEQWEEASNEYLDHDGYRKFKLKDPNHGVVRRMDHNAKALRDLIGWNKSGSVLDELETVAINPEKSGPAAIMRKLQSIDLDALEAEQMEIVRSKKKTKRPNAIKVLNFIQGMRRNDVTPADLMIKKVPVIPPIFRPFSMTGDVFIPGDANELYKDLINLKNSHMEVSSLMGGGVTGDSRLSVYDAVRAVYGLGEPVEPKTKSRGVKGFMQQLTGSSPKFSWMQRRLMSKTLDNISRGVLTVDPELTMDEIAIPAEHAWKTFGPFVQRRMVLAGMTPGEALRNLVDRSDIAKKNLDREMTERPVVYSRAPAWHRYSILAGRAKIHEGDSIGISPLVTTGLNADFNGDDQIGKILVLVPISEESDNLFKDLTLHINRDMVQTMLQNKIIPTFDTTTQSLRMIDLEDFPKGELQRHKKDGKNGEIFFYHVPDGIKVVAFDEATGNPTWAPVAYYSVHPNRSVELVDLSNGRQICTDDDPRAVYGINPSNPDNTLERFTPSQALELGVMVPCVKDVEQACQNLNTLDKIPLQDSSGDTIFEFPLDWNTGWLLGALAGDGWWDKKSYRTESRRCVYLADLSGENAARVYKQLTWLFGETTWNTKEQLVKDDPTRYGDSVRHTFSFRHDKAFTQFLSQWLGGASTDNSTGSAAKHLPEMFLLAPRSFREGLLAGIVDTDGSISAGEAKGKPQMSCAVTSTSIRLANDIKFLALTLGIQSSVSYSKTTIRGNISWIITLSIVDCKRLNIFNNLACEYKRNNFINTSVSADNTSLMYDKVVVPSIIVERVLKDMQAPKLTVDSRKEDTPEITEKRRLQNLYVQWWKARKDGNVSRPLVSKIIAQLASQDALAKSAIVNAIEDLKTGDVVTPERVALWRSAVHAVSPFQDTPERYNKAKSMLARINRPLKTGRCSPTIREGLSKWISETEAYTFAHENPLVLSWIKNFVDVKNIAWAKVVGVQKTGKKETGYDLTVPGSETFMSAEGVILSNTMNAHVPVSKEAVKEAYDRLLPSKMLFSIKDHDKVVPTPKQEMILGLRGTQTRKGAPRSFANDAEALAAIESGEVKMSDELTIG